MIAWLFSEPREGRPEFAPERGGEVSSAGTYLDDVLQAGEANGLRKRFCQYSSQSGSGGKIASGADGADMAAVVAVLTVIKTEFHEPVEAEVAGDLEVWLEPGIQNEGSGCSVQVGGKVRDSGILRGRRRDRPAEGSDQTRGKNAGSSLPGIRVTRHGWPAPVDHRP